jgi:hypothetical protein
MGSKKEVQRFVDLVGYAEPMVVGKM